MLSLMAVMLDCGCSSNFWVDSERSFFELHQVYTLDHYSSLVYHFRFSIVVGHVGLLAAYRVRTFTFKAIK